MGSVIMKKILQLSNYYSPEIGGIEKIAQSITNSLKDEFQIKIVCFTHEKADRVDYVDDIEVTRIGTQMKVASQQLSIHASKIIKRAINHFEPDIIIVHLPNPFLEYLVLKYIPEDTKLFLYWHSDIVKQKVGKLLFHHLTVSVLERADTIIATSPNYIEGSEYLSRYEKKCVVIPNCIDDESMQINDSIRSKMNEIRQRYKDKILCLCVGRQVPYKGFEYVVQAMKLLPSHYQLVIIGREGESSRNIDNLMKKCNNVQKIGEADDVTLRAYMASCDIFCFPSITKNEAFGIALAEGMYFGKPAITFEIPGSGVNYVNLDQKTGIEVANRDVKAFSKAIEELGENKAIRENYGKMARKRVQTYFSYDQFQKNIKRLFSKG